MRNFFVSFVLVSTSITINAQSNSGNTNSMVPTVTCDTVLQLSTCAGGNIIIPYSVTGGNFTFGNVFTAQLSDPFGSFAAPVNIGSIPWIASGIIFGTIPLNANFGFFYRIRVIASNPIDTSNASPNPIFITQVAQLNQIVATPHNYVCPGDTITLTAINFASSYSWSTGDTTMSIQVTTPGIYSVTTTDILTCVSTTSDTLYQTCTGINDFDLNGSLSVYPNPSGGEFYLSLHSDHMANVGMRITNVFGQEVIKEDLYIGMGRPEKIDISGCSSGIYFLQLTTPFGNALRKLVIR